MPPFGGLASSYGQLGDALNDIAQVYGFQAPELFVDDQAYTITELAKYYISHIRRIQPTGPYHLTGWSTGGVIAYEVAQQLAHAGESTGYLGLLDTLPSESKIKQQQVKLGGKPTWYSSIKALYGQSLDVDWSTFENLSQSQGQAQVEAAFINQQMAPAGVSEIMIKRYLRHLGHFAMTLFNHDCTRGKLNFDLFKASEVPPAPQGDIIHFNEYYNWDELTEGLVNVIAVQGQHKSLLQPPNIAPLAQQLGKRLVKFKALSASHESSSKQITAKQ
jgi:thioesterase domain-containing protein